MTGDRDTPLTSLHSLSQLRSQAVLANLDDNIKAASRVAADFVSNSLYGNKLLPKFSLHIIGTNMDRVRTRSQINRCDKIEEGVLFVVLDAPNSYLGTFYAN